MFLRQRLRALVQRVALFLVLDRLLRLLEQVPFCYLVPDSLLLPPESIRFFYVDRNWTDALIQGALSVGTVNSRLTNGNARAVVLPTVIGRRPL